MNQQAATRKGTPAFNSGCKALAISSERQRYPLKGPAENKSVWFKRKRLLIRDCLPVRVRAEKFGKPTLHQIDVNGEARPQIGNFGAESQIDSRRLVRTIVTSAGKSRRRLGINHQAPIV